MFEACTCTVIAEGEVSPVIAANASLTNPVVLATLVDPRRSAVNGGQSTWQKPGPISAKMSDHTFTVRTAPIVTKLQYIKKVKQLYLVFATIDKCDIEGGTESIIICQIIFYRRTEMPDYSTTINTNNLQGYDDRM